MKNFLLLSIAIFSVNFGIYAQSTTTKIVDTINYLGYKKNYGSPKSSGVKIVPTYVGIDSIKVPVAYQKFKNTSRFFLKEVAIPMVSLNPKGATVSVKITHKETILEESILSVSYHATDLTTYWFKFKSPIEISSDYQIDIQPNTYADSIYVPTSGEFVNSSIKADITGNKLTISPSNSNLGTGFWIGQAITGNGIANGTIVTAYNNVSKEYTLSKAVNTPQSGVVVTGLNKTFGSYDAGFIQFSYPIDKTYLPKLLPDFKATPGFSYESLSWDAVKRVSIYEEDFVMYPVIEYDWNNSPQGTAVCLGDSKTVTITSDKTAFDAYVSNPFFNKNAFIQQVIGLGKSAGNFYGRIVAGTENLTDTIDVTDSKLEYAITYSNDNVNDTIKVIETIQTYGYTVSKAITQINKILVSSKMSSSATLSSPILCNAGTGSVNVIGNGGFSPLTGTGTMVGVKAGNQSYFVSDVNGCKSEAKITVVEPTAIAISGTPNTESTCGAKDGKVDVSVSGANAPYTYSWSNLATTQNIASLAAGLYTLTVTDKNNCTKSKDFIVAAIGAPVVSATITQPIKCFGGNATVNVTVTSGGQSPFSGIGVQNNQKSGDKFYTVTDKNNCTSVAKLTITEPTQLVASAVVSDSIKCNGGDAKVLVSATGGVLNYTGLGEITQVKAGSHNYTVIDANNCVSIANIVVSEPALLAANATIKSAINCHYGSGVVAVSATGGTLPYTGIGDKLNVKAGLKTYTVTDGKGCVASPSVTLTEPTLLEVDRTSVSASNDTIKDGKAIVIPTGGTTPYTYAWKDNETLNLLNVNNDTVVVKAGAYAITVTDKNGCSAKTSVTVDALHFVSVAKMDFSGIKTYPNPVIDVLTIRLNADQETKLSLTTLAGQEVVTKTMHGNTTVNLEMSTLSSGMYLLRLTNSSGEYIQKIEKL
jgi:hypothetical protein